MKSSRGAYPAWVLALLGEVACCGIANAEPGGLKRDLDKQQDAGFVETGTIVVTAQRRSESLISVPLAVSAIAGEDLSRQGIMKPSALASLIPNLQENDSTGGAEPNFTLRGIGLGNDYSSNQASPVGVYTDDAYMAFRATHGGQMFDLERIEVLRGPQGTLFGRNTTGGAINFITRKPSLGAPGGYLDLGYGNYDDVRVEAAGEASVIENVLGIRGAVSFDRHDGYIRNIFAGAPDLTDANDLRTRLSIRYNPSDALDVNLRLFANRSRQYQPGVIALGVGPNGVNPLNGYTHAGLSFYDTNADDPHRNKTNSRGGALTVRIKLNDALSVQTLTSYDTAASLFGQDIDGTPINFLETVFHSDYAEFNQEIRLVYDTGPVRAQGGVFYGRDRADIENQYVIFKFLQALGVPPDPTLTAGGAAINQGYRQVRISRAIFGQADVEIVPALTVTVGARYTEDRAGYRNGTSIIGDYDFNPLVQVVGTPGHPLNRQGKNHALTGRVAVGYKPNAATLLYLSYDKGYRAGTFNGSGYLDASQISFVAPERVETYEAGAKGRFFGGAMRVAVAAFYSDYRNQQIQDQIGPVAFLRSAGASTLKGVELDAMLRFAPTASLSANVGYLDGEYDRLTLQNTVLDGNKLPFAPAITAHLELNYTIHHIANGDLTLSPNATYTGAQWFTPYNSDLGYGLLRQNGYIVFNEVSEWKCKTWSVRAWIDNIANKHYYVYGTNLTSFGFYYFNPNIPRTFGVAVRKSF